jgi:hypothetical protein
MCQSLHVGWLTCRSSFGNVPAVIAKGAVAGTNKSGNAVPLLSAHCQCQLACRPARMAGHSWQRLMVQYDEASGEPLQSL